MVTLSNVARHEAAHAVIALALGSRVLFVSRLARTCLHQPPQRTWSLTDGELEQEPDGLRMAAIAAAGVLAVDDTASTPEDFVRLGGSHDLEHMTPDGTELARLLVRMHGAEIERLAIALEANPDGLTGAEVAEVLA